MSYRKHRLAGIDKEPKSSWRSFGDGTIAKRQIDV